MIEIKRNEKAIPSTAKQKSCSNCGSRKGPFIPTYYNPKRGLCSECCHEENRQFDKKGWPDGGCEPEVPADASVLRPGASRSGNPIITPAGQSTRQGGFQ